MPKSPSPVAPPEPHASEHGAKPNPAPTPADEAAASAGAVALRIITVAVLLALVLLPVRAKTAGFWFSSIIMDWDNQLAAALMSACYDVLFLAGGTAFFALTLLPPVRRIVPPKLVWRVYLGFALFTLLASLANLAAVPWLGQPFNYQWLYYSDFFRGSDALASVLAAASVWMMLCGLAAGVVLVFLSACAARWIEARIETPRARASALFLVASMATVYLGASFHSRVPEDWGYDVLANPVWAFGESWVLAARAPEPFTLATPYGPDDFGAGATHRSLLSAERHAPRNVVIIVLESVGAEYVGLYGAKHGVTPELDRQRGRAAVFVNAYAHAPSSNLTLVSLLTGYYPRVSFRPTTAEAPAIGLPRLPELLKGHGFATGFFSSAELDYLGANNFLTAGGDFDYIEDDELRPEAAEQARRRWPDLDGTDDRSTVESMIRWIDAQRPQRFFAVLWTAQTHFPYYVEGEPRPLSNVSPDFNRYLNALEQGDRALGRLLAWLDENDLADDTLVIVLGDHGEAFGQHKNYGHAGNVFEENLRIPLVLINRRLFNGDAYSTPCGMSDIAPTIADILRVADVPRWQGRSLFSAERPARVYFFAALSGFLLGFREGDTKFIYHATKNKFFVHDLARDPGERYNLAATLPEMTRDAALRISAWVQHVEKSYSEALSEGALSRVRATPAARRLATVDDPLLPPPMP